MKVCPIQNTSFQVCKNAHGFVVSLVINDCMDEHGILQDQYFDSALEVVGQVKNNLKPGVGHIRQSPTVQ